MTSTTTRPREARGVRRRRAALCMVATLPLLSACGLTTGSAAPSVALRAADVETPLAPPIDSTTTTQGPTSGCETGPATIPAGAVRRQIIDVDGDGRRDTAWLSASPVGAVTAGIVTAAGGGTTRAWDSASPSPRTLLAVAVNDTMSPILLAEDGRSVQLWTFEDCTIEQVMDAQNVQYTFPLGLAGAKAGTGVGCAVVDGRNELVGFDIDEAESGADVAWSSTVVMVDGTDARKGRVTTGTYRSPDDDASIEALRGVSCGDETAGADGLLLAR